MTPTLHIPDVSEYQRGADLSRLAAVILRAHNGHRPDRAHTEHRRSARTARVVGHYGYVVAHRDAATQGREFAAAVGKLGPGEFAVCDLEEGDGDQTGRAEAWCAAVDHALGGKAVVYSGRSFFATHLAGVMRTRWVAAYGSTEPRGPHLLWQHSDREKFRGKGLGAVDCSVFHGTAVELRAIIDRQQGRTPPAMQPRPAQVAPKPSPAPVPSASPVHDPRFVYFDGAGDVRVYEVSGSRLLHVTFAAWTARGLQRTDVRHLPHTHPLNSLPKETP